MINEQLYTIYGAVHGSAIRAVTNLRFHDNIQLAAISRAQPRRRRYAWNLHCHLSRPYRSCIRKTARYRGRRYRRGFRSNRRHQHWRHHRLRSRGGGPAFGNRPISTFSTDRRSSRGPSRPASRVSYQTAGSGHRRSQQEQRSCAKRSPTSSARRRSATSMRRAASALRSPPSR